MKELKPINGLNDLEHYGITILTGERDGLLLGRILCDLSKEGCLLLIDYFGLSNEITFQRAWNQRVGNEPAVGSVMLTAETLWQIAVFALLRAGAKFVYMKEGLIHLDDGEMWNAIDEAYAQAGKTHEALGVAGGSITLYCRDTIPDYLQNWHRYRNLGRNFDVHQMSGRQ